MNYPFFSVHVDNYSKFPMDFSQPSQGANPSAPISDTICLYRTLKAFITHPAIIKELPSFQVSAKSLEIQFYCQKCSMTVKHSNKDCKLSHCSIYPAECFAVLGEEWLGIRTVAAGSFGQGHGCDAQSMRSPLVCVVPTEFFWCRSHSGSLPDVC